MGRRQPATAEQKAQIVLLRELGLSASAIAEQIGLSVRTVQRVYKSNGVLKGEFGDELLAEARSRLRDRVLGDERVQDAVVTHLLDDMACVRKVRDKAAAILEDFTPESEKDRAVFMRCAAAYSTMLKNTSDIMRRVVDLDRFREVATTESLPELVVRSLTEEEVEQIRREQVAEAKKLGIAGDR